MSGPAGPPGASERPRVRTAVAVLVTTLGFGLAGGGAGLLAAGGLLAVWYLSSVLSAVALGHVLVGALLAGEPATVGVGIVEIGLFGLLSTAGAIDTLRDGAAFLVFTALLGGVAFLGWEAGGTTAAAGSLAGSAVLIGYGLHRYELLRLGLLETGAAPDAPDRPGRADQATDDAYP